MAHEKNHPYHIIDPSPWPVLGGFGAIVMLSGAVLWMKGITAWVALIGIAIVLYTMFVWWRDMVHESRAGETSPVARIGMRLGFIMFIMSEVMFFVAWFWAFFKFAIFPMVDPSTLSVPTSDAPVTGVFGPDQGFMMDPWNLPLINTLILLLSGCTVTWAHHDLVEGKRSGLLWGLLFTVILGAVFTIFQAFEYSHASFPFGTDDFGSVFFMATGFHGFHVLVGTIFLIVCLVRANSGDFTPREHVGFEAAAWYWHFVDVVWLFLFACIYIWGHAVWAGVGH